jgi:hypothetical protein
MAWKKEFESKGTRREGPRPLKLFPVSRWCGQFKIGSKVAAPAVRAFWKTDLGPERNLRNYRHEETLHFHKRFIEVNRPTSRSYPPTNTGSHDHPQMQLGPSRNLSLPSNANFSSSFAHQRGWPRSGFDLMPLHLPHPHPHLRPLHLQYPHIPLPNRAPPSCFLPHPINTLLSDRLCR